MNPQLYKEIIFEVARSRGPGGQNVNRTNTAMILRWNAPASAAFTDEQKARLLKKLGPRLNKNGDLQIRSEEFRSQEQNKRRCLEKFEVLVQSAFFIPKKRVKTKPTKSSIERRHKSKKKKSETKKLRARVKMD